ncbi:ATP-grasp domain-containing protein [Guggenheimella bovis]
MKKVLILGVAPTQRDAIGVLKDMNIETFAIAKALDGPGAALSDHFEAINFLDTQKVIEFIKEKEIELVYSAGSDIAMPEVAKLSEYFSTKCFFPPEVPKICNNKGLMRKTLGKDFKGNVPFDILKEKQNVSLPFPFMMKPADSQGQRGIHPINSQEDFDKYFEETKEFSRSGEVIVERFIGGFEVSANIYMKDGKMVFCMVSDRITFEEYTGIVKGHITPAVSIDETTTKKIEAISEATCKKVGILNGPAYIQFKIFENEPYIIEITPRLDGCHLWNAIYHATGFNLLKLTLEDLIFGTTEELKKYTGVKRTIDLNFITQPPHTPMAHYEKPDGSLYFETYYKEGDTVRPINTFQEKIGYSLEEHK